ncbi:type IX secretion system membrane protein PorP/SprF [Halieaceae bacterium IMCC14734]|uniref:Type IX secretion system membrane protein PorP/SprF n=1 Tax=Candidatus Litorirhabdus singularis TaxID=2518993 RepID=A0ABT3TET8_9GAMM|nr:conjugal transfer protein TraF [Candidatus Litorirhabdus singularis]MCX2980827.1 type IX secretion system membrane protein PorP/SprF [Candidatus Litorirhabdus singularis]
MSATRLLFLLITLFHTIAVSAEPVYQPPGANLTYGNVTHGQRVLSATSNPAAAAADVYRGGGKATSGTVVSGVAGIEYGNVQELFDTIDDLSKGFEPSDPGGESGAAPENPKEPIDIGNIIDTNAPNFNEIVDDIAKEVTAQAAILALISVEGYGKAFVSADIPFVIGTELLGGAWTLGVNWSGTSKAYGFVRPIEFDFDKVLEDIKNDYDPSQTPDGKPRLYDVSGDVNILVDQATGSYGINFANDSSFLTKAVKTFELSVGYGWLAKQSKQGNLFLGIEGKYYNVGLSRFSVRFGDFTDSEEIFDSLRNSNFVHDKGFGVDFGTLWVARNYQLGATLTNINEPKFEYPDVDISSYSDQVVISFLQKDKHYTMERQLKIEASYFTTNRKLTVNLGLDANNVEDPVGDDFQWLTMSAGYVIDSWWLPGVRFGYRQNLAGTELKYLSVGVTAFKILNIDIASSLEQVKINGTKLPQGLIASMGFDISF